MDETLKIVLAIAVAIIYFVVQSSKKPASGGGGAAPEKISPPVREKKAALNEKNVSFQDILKALQQNNDEQKPLPPKIDRQQEGLLKPTSERKIKQLISDKKPETEEDTVAGKIKADAKKRIDKQKAEDKKYEGHFAQYSKKGDASDPEEEANKSRFSEYGVKPPEQHPILKLLSDPQVAKHAVILSEILNRKY